MRTGLVMKCPNCLRDVPEDALFCPYCGFRLEFSFIEVNDLGELEKIASTLNRRFLPGDWKCIVDVKKRRLLFAPNPKAIFLAGFAKRSRATIITTLTLALDEALRHAEEELGIKLQLVEMSKISYLTRIPYLYYKVFTKQKERQKP